jgi:phosphoenolpyruvate phosphomutase
MAAWGDTCPVVIVPTNYYKTSVQVFRGAGISLVIWANHSLRASIAAMQRTVASIYESQSLLEVEKEIVPVKEVFRLQDMNELKQAEDRYLPAPSAENLAA